MNVDPDRWMKLPVPEPLPETLVGLNFGESWQTIYAVQERWKRLAVAEKPESAPFTNFDLFVKDVDAEVAPHVVEFRPYEVGFVNNRWLGSAFLKTLAEFKARDNDWRVSVPVKTGRAPGFAESDGVQDPRNEATEAMKQVATRWGLGDPHWEPCEKGWGSFVMKVTPATTLVALLHTMGAEEVHTWVLPSGTHAKVFRGPGGWHVKPPVNGVRRVFSTAVEAAEALNRGGR